MLPPTVKYPAHRDGADPEVDGEDQHLHDVQEQLGGAVFGECGGAAEAGDAEQECGADQDAEVERFEADEQHGDPDVPQEQGEQDRDEDEEATQDGVAGVEVLGVGKCLRGAAGGHGVGGPSPSPPPARMAADQAPRQDPTLSTTMP